MKHIDPGFPLLTIAGCAFDATDYQVFESEVADFKGTILSKPRACIHSTDIRKWEGDFSGVLPADRDHVRSAISELMARARFTLITVTIRKDRLGSQYHAPRPPYELAMQYLLERFYRLLGHTRTWGVVYAESRGRREDGAVADEYSRFRLSGFDWATPAEVQSRLPGPIGFLSKTIGCAGIEAADLSAHPVARYLIDPTHGNRAFDVLQPKLYAGSGPALDYSFDGTTGVVTVGGSWFTDRDMYWKHVGRYGLKVFPK